MTGALLPSVAARMRTLRRSAILLVPPALVLFTSACATAWARGVVRDQDGRPVSGATVALSEAGAPGAASTSVSESNGCFNVVTSARREQETFVLTVRATGYKDLSMSFRRRERLTATVLLMAESQPGSSALTRLSGDEERRVYEEACIPPAVPNATSLTLH